MSYASLAAPMMTAPALPAIDPAHIAAVLRGAGYAAQSVAGAAMMWLLLAGPAFLQ